MKSRTIYADVMVQLRTQTYASVHTFTCTVVMPSIEHTNFHIIYMYLALRFRVEAGEEMMRSDFRVELRTACTSMSRAQERRHSETIHHRKATPSGERIRKSKEPKIFICCRHTPRSSPSFLQIEIDSSLRFIGSKQNKQCKGLPCLQIQLTNNPGILVSSGTKKAT
jgi:hypothetical protein